MTININDTVIQTKTKARSAPPLIGQQKLWVCMWLKNQNIHNIC